MIVSVSFQQTRNTIVNLIGMPNMLVRRLAKKLTLPDTTICNVIKISNEKLVVDREPGTIRKLSQSNKHFIDELRCMDHQKSDHVIKTSDPNR